MNSFWKMRLSMLDDMELEEVRHAVEDLIRDRDLLGATQNADHGATELERKIKVSTGGGEGPA